MEYRRHPLPGEEERMKRVRLAILVALSVTVLSAAAMAQSDGADAFKRCAGCHKDTGMGVPGYAPPLAAHIPDIGKSPGGRTYLIQVLLYGLKGEILVKGKRFTANMPAFADLNDQQAAAVLNLILTNWGNDKLLPKDHKPIAPEEVKAQRENRLTAEQVLAIRGKLGLN
jgi:mono/diheme cytochrome c family protein